MRSMFSRLRLASQAFRTYSGLAPPANSSLARKPNFVATIASFRRLPSALPRNRSLFVPPYISAVSKKLIPASSAALTTSAVWFSSIVMPKLLQPRPTTETERVPMLRFSMITGVAAAVQVRGVVCGCSRTSPREIGDVAADGLSAIVFDGLARKRRGNRILEVVARRRRALDSDGGVAIVDAAAIRHLSFGVVDRSLRRDGRASAFHKLVPDVANRRARQLEFGDMAVNVGVGVRWIGIDEPEGNAGLCVLVLQLPEIGSVAIRHRARRAHKQQDGGLRPRHRWKRIEKCGRDGRDERCHGGTQEEAASHRLIVRRAQR